MKKSPVYVDGLAVSYGKKIVLTNIHLEIEPGNVIGVVGPNGAGKSTLFKSILGLIEIDSGEIEVFGEEMDKVRQRVAYVPQRDDVDWTFPAKVKDVVLLGRYPYKKVWQRMNKEDMRIVREALEEVGIADLADRQIGELSGGQQQRVFIARAIAQEADLMMLDEPFVGVDITTEHKIIQTLKKLASQGKTLMVVHHDLSTVNSYFDELILLNQHLIAYGDTNVLFTEENMRKAYGGQQPLLHQKLS